MMKVMDKLRPAEFPPAFRWLVWEVLHGLGEDLSGCSAKTVDSQNPFYFSTVSEFPSWHLSPQTCPVSGKGRFISSLCFTAGVRRLLLSDFKEMPPPLPEHAAHAGLPARAGAGGGCWQFSLGTRASIPK